MKTLLYNLIGVLLSVTISQKIIAQCSPVGDGTDGGIYCLYADSNIDELCLGGSFTTSGNDTLNNCGFWNDSTFIPMGMAGYYGTDDSVLCALHFNGNIYYGGSFINAGGVTVNCIAMWDGSAWHPVGAGFNGIVRCFEVYQGALYAGGDFTMSGTTAVNHIAEWTGTQWIQPGNGLNNAVYAMRKWNSDLYIGGRFTMAGSTPLNYICSWDGLTYAALGSGISYSSMMSTPVVYAMGLYKGDLWVGGMFDHAGGISMNNLAKWDGSSWSSVGDIGTGMGANAVLAICVYDSDLFVGGNFGMCGSASASNIGMWDGSNWSTIGAGMNGIVHALAAYNNKLYIGGLFNDAAGTTVSNIAKYSRTTGIISLAAHKDNPMLYPNPARTSFSLHWNQNIDSPVTFILYNNIGDKLMERDLGSVSPGSHIFSVNTSELNTGIYIYMFKKGDSVYNGELSIVK